MKIKSCPTTLSLVFAGLLALHAQPVNVQQFQNNQQAQQFKVPSYDPTTATNAPELYTGENTDVGPQRILRRSPIPDYFNIFFDSQVYYSDNANFAQGTNIIGSAVFVNTVQATIAPPEITLGPLVKLAPSAGVISQWYNYGNNQMTSFDFDALTFFVSGRYSFNNWQITIGGNYTLLLDQGEYHWTYQELLPVLTVQRLFPIGEKFLFVVGDQIDYHFTDVPSTAGSATAINNRFDEIVNLGLNWQLTRHLSLQPYGRFQYSNYRYNTLQTSDRNDYLYSVGVTLAYYFNEYCSLRTFFNYNIKETDDSVTRGYHEYNGGLGGSLNFSF